MTDTLQQSVAQYTDTDLFPPGPYIVTGPNGYINQIGIGRETGPNGYVDPIGVAYGAGKQVEAIANLFAAAPDMLMKLRNLVAECSECVGTGRTFIYRNKERVDIDCPDCADIRSVTDYVNTFMEHVDRVLGDTV